MDYQISISYSTDNGLVSDDIKKMIESVLPYMVDNVKIKITEE